MTGTGDGGRQELEGQVCDPQGRPLGALVLTSPLAPPQSLLREAHEVELQRQKEAEKLDRQLALPTTEQAATQESTFREMCQGLLEESDEEEKDGEPGRGQDRGPEAGGDHSGGAEAPATPARLAAVDKKTEQQRRREKAAQMLVRPVGSGLLSLLPQPDIFFPQSAFCHPCHLLLCVLWNPQVACG